MYYVSLFTGDGFCLENHCFFDRKRDAINYYNKVIEDNTNNKFVSNIKTIEVRHDNCVLMEVNL